MVFFFNEVTFLRVKKMNRGRNLQYPEFFANTRHAGLKNRSDSGTRFHLSLTADQATQELTPHYESLSGLPPSRPRPPWHFPLPVSLAATAGTPGAAFDQLSSLHSHQRNFWTSQTKQLWNRWNLLSHIGWMVSHMWKGNTSTEDWLIKPSVSHGGTDLNSQHLAFWALVNHKSNQKRKGKGLRFFITFVIITVSPSLSRTSYAISDISSADETVRVDYDTAILTRVVDDETLIVCIVVGIHLQHVTRTDVQVVPEKQDTRYKQKNHLSTANGLLFLTSHLSGSRFSLLLSFDPTASTATQTFVWKEHTTQWHTSLVLRLPDFF